MNNQVESIQEQSGLKTFFAKIYGFLAMGIGISGVVSYLVSTVFKEAFMSTLESNSWLIFVLMGLEFLFVVVLTGKAFTNPPLALASFIMYSLLNGLTLSVVLFAYTSQSIVSAFVSAAVTFGVMAVIGTRTKKDLTGIGQAAFSFLIGIIVVSLINIFILRSSLLEFFIAILMVLIFAGLTAYDHQKIKVIYDQHGESENAIGLAVYCALNLYLDFINLFLAFLRIFGKQN